MAAYSEFLYVTLILPSLFAITLIGEGVYKYAKHESGWIALLSGSVFLVIVISVYIVIFV